ncbi:hypothetical protein [Pseudomonas sp. MGal98]|uniref:hypothetical protein n=1 Tax=Pseudomonas sp. MGal98 TaxID=3162460 RepID=UPI0032ED1BF2
MNRLKNLTIAIFVSPEFLGFLCVLTFVIFAPEKASNIGEAIRSDEDVWKYLPALTLIFAGATINYSFKLRAPLEAPTNKVLYHWPLYQILVDRVYISLFYGVCSGIASITLWFLGRQLEAHHVAFIFLTATLISGLTALTMLLAIQKLKEILTANI